MKLLQKHIYLFPSLSLVLKGAVAFSGKNDDAVNQWTDAV